MGDPSRPVTGYPATQPPPNHQAATYPYPAPPPPSSYYPSGQNPNAYAYSAYPVPYAPRAAFWRRFFGAAIMVFLIFGVVLLITWLVLRPRLPEFALSSLTVSNLTASAASGRLSAEFTAGLSAYNANKRMSVGYDEVRCSISYGEALLGDAGLPPFQQPVRNRTALTVSVSVSESYVGERAARGVADGLDRGAVSFDVHLVARVWFRTGGWRTRRRVLFVLCEGASVEVGAGGSGKLTGGDRRCRVGI